MESIIRILNKIYSGIVPKHERTRTCMKNESLEEPSR